MNSECYTGLCSVHRLSTSMNSIRTIISMQATIEIWVFAHHARYSGLVMHFLSSNVAIYAMMSAISKKNRLQQLAWKDFRLKNVHR